MQKEIDNFNNAVKALKKAESALNKKVNVEIRKAGDDEDKLIELIEKLPEKNYNGCQRIYAKILSLRCEVVE